jgi:hypothetical protein
MKRGFASASAASILVAGMSTAALAQTTSPAYRYSGPHAGGPANALNRGGKVQPVVRSVKAPGYRYSGSHAGGPANGLPRN